MSKTNRKEKIHYTHKNSKKVVLSCQCCESLHGTKAQVYKKARRRNFHYISTKDIYSNNIIEIEYFENFLSHLSIIRGTIK